MLRLSPRVLVSRCRNRRRGTLLLLFFVSTLPNALSAQTDFYNLDHGRPLRVEDAYSAKRWAFELQASPFDLSRDRAGTLRFVPALELKHGILPGLDVSVGTGIENVRDGSESTTRFEDVEVSALLNLWVEGSAIPAAAIRLSGHLPTESGRSATMEAKGVLTRGLRGPVRGHLNAAIVAGEDRHEKGWVGAALDYVLPFQHTLLSVETWVSFPRLGDNLVHSSLGARFQATPTLVLDGGLGREWAGSERRDWVIKLGVTHEFGLRAFIPGGDR